MSLSAASSSIIRLCSICGTRYAHGTEHQCAGQQKRASEGGDLIGAILGERYRIVSALSKGGMGVVYKAQHIVLDKPVAVKVMLTTQDDAAHQRFLQEAKLASLVHHPNIVDIIDFGVLTSREPYLVMELLVGQTLADAIAQGPLSARRVCSVAAQVARGLHAVHEKGIIHRDLKPANIFLIRPSSASAVVPAVPAGDGRAAADAAAGAAETDEVAKVVDFAIATVVAQDTIPRDDLPPGQTPARLTVPGMVMGTAEYMSPEQAQGMKTDHRADQYALGCIMYEMVTGRAPYQGTTPAATMLKHLTERPTPPSRVRPERNIPAALESIIDRAMALRPDDRYESMSALERELMMLGDNLRNRPNSTAALKLPALPDLAKLAQRSIKPTRTGFYALGVGFLVCLLIIGGLVVKLRRTTQQVRRVTADVQNLTQKANTPTILWVIKSDPPGAQVVRSTDQTVLGTTPWRHEMIQGTGQVQVELKLEGYQPVQLKLSRASDEQRTSALQPIPVTKPAVKKGASSKKVKGKKRAGSVRDNDDVAIFK